MDKKQFEELCSEFYKDVYYISFKIIGNEETAKDITQDTFTKAWEKIDTLIDAAKFRSWILTIANNLAINYMKRNGIIKFVSTDDDNILIEIEDERKGPEEVNIDNDVKEILTKLINGLPREQKIVVTMFYYEELTVKEIAEICECSEKTVYSRLSYAKKKLREEVDKLTDEGVRLRCSAVLPFIHVILTMEANELLAAAEAAATALADGTAALTAATAAGADAGTGGRASKGTEWSEQSKEPLNIDEESIKKYLKPYQMKPKISLITLFGGLAYCIIAIVVGILMITKLNNVNMGAALMVSGILVVMACAVIGGLLYSKSRKEYLAKFKSAIGVPLIKSMFGDVKYLPKGEFPRHEFNMAGFIHYRPRCEYTYKSEDLIYGEYRGVKFKQADLYVSHRTVQHNAAGGTERGEIKVDINGRIWAFEYPKYVESRVFIAKTWSKLWAESAMKENGNLVELEDIAFNGAYSVYAEDQQTAFYVLTPHVMEYLLYLSDLDFEVYFCFYQNRLYVIQSGKGGIFEPSSMKLDVTMEIFKAKKDLNVINDIIKALKLDNII